MEDLLSIWLYENESDALRELGEYDLKERNDMAAKAQAFADWLALQNSRAISQ